MSSGDLKTDLALNVAALNAVNASDPGELLAYMQNTLWPFLESMVETIATQEENLDELSDVVDELSEGTAEVLHSDTAGLFATVIVGARQLVALIEGKQPITPETIAAVKAACDLAEQALEDVTVPDGDPDDDNDDNEEGDDDDDDGDD